MRLKYQQFDYELNFKCHSINLQLHIVGDDLRVDADLQV